MCEPTTIAMGAMAVAGGVSAYSQYQQGNFMADQAEYNAKVAEQNAQAEEVAGGDQAAQIRERGRAIRARQSAAGAASGLQVGSGTNLDILLDTAQGSELDAQTAVYNSKQRAYGMRIGADQLRTQGKLDKWSSRYGAASTLVGSGAQAYGMTRIR